VDLLVAVRDAGPPTRIDPTQVHGAPKNSREAILDYLALKSGCLLTRREQSA